MKIFKVIFSVSLLIAIGTAQSKTLNDCRSITAANLRLICYDEIVDAQQQKNVRVPAPAAPITQPIVQSVAQPVVPAVTLLPSKGSSPIESLDMTGTKQKVLPMDALTKLFGSQKEVFKEMIAEDFGIIQLDKIEAQVEEISDSAFNKLILRLDNEHTWQQTDSTKLRIREGDQVIIRSGRMGAFFLEKADGSRAIRVKRIL